jgi:hypothetical protein
MPTRDDAATLGLFNRADVDDQRPVRQLGPELVQWDPIKFEAGVGEQLSDRSSPSR